MALLALRINSSSSSRYLPHRDFNDSLYTVVVRSRVAVRKVANRNFEVIDLGHESKKKADEWLTGRLMSSLELHSQTPQSLQLPFAISAMLRKTAEE